MEKWVEIRKAGNFKEIGQACGISPVTARVLRNRDLVTADEMDNYLHPNRGKLHDASLMSGMEEASLIILSKIKEGKKIRIIGDYDVDGISSTFILYKGISFFGGLCDYRIPHRIEDGYGININMIDEAHAAGIDTIITCDNGISAYNQTLHAKELELTMVITDHHEVPFEDVDGERKYIIPKADAIVDPKLPSDTYPFSGICGAFVAFKFLEVLHLKAKESGFYGDTNGANDALSFDESLYEELMLELTEFAALATVCDVMELKDENRVIVYKGMKLLEKSRNLGMRALIDTTQISGKVLSSYHLGFIIGPCLNASGRLDTSLKALELFLETDVAASYARAEELKKLNDERKDMTSEAVALAENIVESKETLDKILVVYLKDCHESLAGIVAGRIREKYSRPTFVVTKTEKGLKGSGRSIDAYDMYEGLVAVSDCMTKFGGHKLAAGISLEEEKLEEFTRRLNENCDLTDEDFVETVRIDMELPFDYVRVDLAKELCLLEPFGNGNPKPLMALRDVTVISGQYLGKSGLYGKYKVSDSSGRVYEMIYFGDIHALEDYVCKIYGSDEAANLHKGVRVNVKLSIVYEIGLNEFRGNESAQIIMKYYR